MPNAAKKDSLETALSGQTIRIRGIEMPITHAELDVSKLKYYVANPRVYSLVRHDGRTPSQSDIETELLQLEHVKVLIQDIKDNGGLMEPILVKADTWEVIEGNSRLAAYRALADSQPIKWAKIKCAILPQTITDAQVFALLVQFHVKGKKDWAKYEQAGMLYRRKNEEKVDIPTLVRECGLPPQSVKHLIDTYEFMRDAGDTDRSHWSHYDEFLKSRAIATARENYPSFDSTVVDLIKSDKTFRAVDVRDKLPRIAKGPPKNLKKFANGQISFEAAADIAEDSGAANKPYRRMNKFRLWLASEDVSKTIRGAAGDERHRIKFELDRIKSCANSLLIALSKN